MRRKATSVSDVTSVKANSASRRTFLIHQIRVIGFLDKDFSAKEKELYQSLKEIVLAGVDLQELSKETETIEHESHSRQSIFEKISKRLDELI